LTAPPAIRTLPLSFEAENDVQRAGGTLYIWFGLVLLTVTSLTPRAEAQDAAPPGSTPPPNSPEACRAIRGEHDRLSCYDRLFGAPEGALLEQTPGPAAAAVAAAEAVTTPEPTSLLEERWELGEDQRQGTFKVQPHKPVYILAAYHSSRANEMPSSPSDGHSVIDSLNLSNTETKFQISLKSKLWEGVIGESSDLWFGYTQSSRWQLFNAELSRPFRETDYEPELMLNFNTHWELPFGWDMRMSGLSITHVSNGRDVPLSRSWNRVIGWVGFDRPGWTLMVRPWWRMHEDRSSDDNPDIEDYMGRGELMVTRNWRGHEISAAFRHSLREGDRAHSGLELNWAFPIHGELKGYLQYFSGYGESLIDYNHSASYFGIGVSLIEWYSHTARLPDR
jgi:phospholipase A1